MPETEIKIKGFECTRCGHKWIPHDINKKPITCPNCKSPFWDKPKRTKVSSKKPKRMTSGEYVMKNARLPKSVGLPKELDPGF